MLGTTAVRLVRISPLLAVIIVPLLIHGAIVETSQLRWAAGFGGLFRFGLITTTALTHWTIYAGLFITFAVTLRPGREALITALAIRLQGTIPNQLAVYTRKVTWAWCFFFAVQLALSVSLFFFAPLVIWSFFVNVLDVPLVAMMFAAEYFCRLRCLHDPPRHSLAQVIRMVADIRNTSNER